ncbi:MAG: YaaC family protein [Blastomonas fulva]|uniref:YaaC family protein n=1 Tax=Blastomonas fulva TaxID=1550728 RepID=UPI0024E1D339|nr:YaaC family protein [Blastomonas fulva]MDK2755994.1 YaaC family protein [Blastomonas fulva]
MKLHEARAGEVVLVRQRPVAFSFFPTYQGTKREGLQSTLFASEPWHIIQHVLEKIANKPAKRQAIAFLLQSKDFFSAAQSSDVSAAKPLLLYYSFLNLAKCLIVRRSGVAIGAIQHGISEQLPIAAGSIHGHVNIDITRRPTQSAFVQFANALGATLPTPTAPQTSIRMRSQDFLGQILIGHRIFCQSEDLVERFISLEAIDYMHEPETKEAWLRVRAFADDFTRLAYPMTGLSKNLTNSEVWRSVKCNKTIRRRRIIEAEMIGTINYNHRPSQILETLSSANRARLWRSVTSSPPYRKYYIYQPQPTQTILDQLLTIYISTYYFGSITRYKPEQLNFILKSPIGPFVFEFFANQPSQFLYLMSSEFMKQEVAKAAIT